MPPSPPSTPPPTSQKQFSLRAVNMSTSLGLTERRCEQCENCFSHVESVYCSQAVKNCNNRHVPVLLTCARCKEVRYCSRQCQREQWIEHKYPCESNRRIMLALSILGPQVDRTFKAFAKYCKAIGGFLEVPAISALELRWGKGRVNTHVFLVKIRAKETIFKKTSKTTRGCITFKVVSAECKSMKEMHELLDWRSGPFSGPEVTERTMAHRPGLLRIFVMDVSGILPAPLDGYTLPTDISNWPPSYHKKYDPKWLDNLLESIGQPKNGPLAGEDEFASSLFSVSCEEPQVPPARPSSPIEDPESSTVQALEVTDVQTAIDHL